MLDEDGLEEALLPEPEADDAGGLEVVELGVEADELGELEAVELGEVEDEELGELEADELGDVAGVEREAEPEVAPLPPLGDEGAVAVRVELDPDWLEAVLFSPLSQAARVPAASAAAATEASNRFIAVS